MPKIPQYNQGMGPRVSLATGRLAPRLDSALFETAAQSQAEMARSVIGVAEAFETRRQNEFEEDVIASVRNQFDEAATEYNLNDQSKSINEYNQNWQKFYQQFESGLDLGNISKSRQENVQSALLNQAQSYKVAGMKPAFDREQSAKVETIVKSAEITRSSYVSGMVGRDAAIASYSADYERASRNGLQDRLIKPSAFAYELDKEMVFSVANDKASTIDTLLSLEDEIRSGEGVYSQYDLQQRQGLLSLTRQRMNEMEGVEKQELLASADDALASMSMAANDDEFVAARDGGYQLADELRNRGHVAVANDLVSKVKATDFAIGLFNKAAFKDAAFINDMVLKNKNALMSEVNTENAAESLYAIKALDAAHANHQKAIAEDAGGYVVSQYQRMHSRRPSPAQIVQIQRSMGLDDSQITPFTNAEFDSMMASLTGASAEDTINSLSSFFQQFPSGDTRDVAMGAAMRKGMSVTQNMAMTRPNDPRARDLLNSVNVDDKLIKASLEARDVKLADVQVAVADEMQDYRSSMIGNVDSGYLDQTASSGRLNILFKMQAAMTKLAATYMTSDPSLSAEDAAKMAVSFISEQYVFPKASKGKSTIRVPMGQFDNAEDIANALDLQLTKPGFVEGLGVLPSASGVAENVSEEDLRSIYAREIRQKGRWATLDDDSGVVLLDDFGNPVMQSRNRLGEPMVTPVIYTWDHVNNVLAKELLTVKDMVTRPGLGIVEVPVE